MQEANMTLPSALQTLQEVGNYLSRQIANDPTAQELIDQELIDQELIDQALIAELERRIQENPDFREKLRRSIEALSPGKSMDSMPGTPGVSSSSSFRKEVQRLA